MEGIDLTAVALVLTLVPAEAGHAGAHVAVVGAGARAAVPARTVRAKVLL